VGVCVRIHRERIQDRVNSVHATRTRNRDEILDDVNLFPEFAGRMYIHGGVNVIICSSVKRYSRLCVKYQSSDKIEE
jgi:hypothetical protein